MRIFSDPGVERSFYASVILPMSSKYSTYCPSKTAWNLKATITNMKRDCFELNKILQSPSSVFIPADLAMYKYGFLQSDPWNLMLRSSSSLSPRGPDSPLSMIKPAREKLCVGQPQAELQELHDPLPVCRMGENHWTLWTEQWHHNSQLVSPDRYTSASVCLPAFPAVPRVLPIVTAEVWEASVGLLSKEVEAERTVALIDAGLAGCSFSVQNCSLQCDWSDSVDHRHFSVKGSQLGAQNNSCYLGLNFKDHLLFHTVCFICIYPRQ